MEPKNKHSFDAKAFPQFAQCGEKLVDYQPAEAIFSQGDPSTLPSSTFSTEREAVSALQDRQRRRSWAIKDADFFGEGAGQPPVRLATATAMTASTVLVVRKRQMIRLLHRQHSLGPASSRICRKNSPRSDLIDRLFSASKNGWPTRCFPARALRKPEGPQLVLPKISQEVLAEMDLVRRSRVNFFMNKFRKLGFIEEVRGGLKVHHALLSVVLHD